MHASHPIDVLKTGFEKGPATNLIQGVNLLLCFFEDIKTCSKLWFPLLSVCVHRTSCRADRWQVDRHTTGRVEKKSQHFEKKKHNFY